jgi:uncharacterized membrane protein
MTEQQANELLAKVDQLILDLQYQNERTDFLIQGLDFVPWAIALMLFVISIILGIKLV